ncbi:hypothetical protein [Rhodococcus sp. JS3073]|uniref:hypothetical protein n=1 Tax=Rhodococcus sp. JS3073 TaxID=3002901 RepID=UPI0022859740|nr:hypothetical protein [Rhodococcus sp. JS3073]WAM13934.1 hypothetical protein OYT95_31610 [Rhodococcus sp. JS3073]
MTGNNELRYHGVAYAEQGLYMSAPMELARDGNLSQAARSVALYMWSHDASYRSLSLKSVADALGGTSQSTVRTALAHLEDCGWLIRQPLVTASKRQPFRYIFHMQRERRFTAEERKAFSAEIVIAKKSAGTGIGGSQNREAEGSQNREAEGSQFLDPREVQGEVQREVHPLPLNAEVPRDLRSRSGESRSSSLSEEPCMSLMKALDDGPALGRAILRRSEEWGIDDREILSDLVSRYENDGEHTITEWVTLLNSLEPSPV